MGAPWKPTHWETHVHPNQKSIAYTLVFILIFPVCFLLKTKIQWFTPIVLKGYEIYLSSCAPWAAYIKTGFISVRGLFMDITVGKIKGGYSYVTAWVSHDAGHLGSKSPVLSPSLPGQRGLVKPKETICRKLVQQKCLSVAPPYCSVITQPEGSVIWA